MTPEMLQVIMWVGFAILGVACAVISSALEDGAPFCIWVVAGITLAVVGCVTIERDWQGRKEKLEGCLRGSGENCMALATANLVGLTREQAVELEEATVMAGYAVGSGGGTLETAVQLGFISGWEMVMEPNPPCIMGYTGTMTCSGGDWWAVTPSTNRHAVVLYDGGLIKDSNNGLLYLMELPDAVFYKVKK